MLAHPVEDTASRFLVAQALVERSGLSPVREGFVPAAAKAATGEAALVKEVREGDLVLVKGSRGVATDKIVKAIRARFPVAGSDEETGQ